MRFIFQAWTKITMSNFLTFDKAHHYIDVLATDDELLTFLRLAQTKLSQNYDVTITVGQKVL